MTEPEKVTLLKSGNKLVVEPTTQHIADLITPVLTFEEKRFFRGWERRKRVKSRMPPFELIEWACYTADHKQRLACAWGFWKLIKDTLTNKGYKVVARNLKPRPNPEIFNPMWERLDEFGIDLRYRQDDALMALIANLQADNGGRLRMPTGSGKSFIPLQVGMLLPKAKIDIVTKRVIALCKEREITINKLATLSGMTQSTLDNIIKGRSKSPGLRSLHRLAQGLGMTLSQFLDFPEIEETQLEDE